jgi:2-polyprenyl-3-methyl-5-hydroxy-6-metoxy-1,4-benzoquinol methylase
MPFSTNVFKKETLNFIKNKFNRTSTVLDIGAGAGIYADHLKDYFYRMDAVEGFEPYVEKYALKQKYANVFIKNILDFDFSYYDLIIFGDVLEHIDEEAGIKLVEKLYDKCNDLIIAIPYNSEQDSHFGNDLEIHKQTELTKDSFLEKYKGFKVLATRHDYGIFIKDNEANKSVTQTIEGPREDTVKSDLTVVTGLWNIGRPGRSFDEYLLHFRKILETDVPMFIHIPEEYEHVVWEIRSRHNTYVKIWELSDMKEMYSSFWDKTQEIRTSEEWLNLTGEGGWLKNSPQAVLEWYNPIVMSKFSMLHNVTVWNPFQSNYFIWLDAGITNTVYEKYFTDDKVLDNLIPHLDPFLFLSYPYEARDEIHGFKIDAMNKFARAKVDYVCRGGLFGGHIDAIKSANGMYWHLLNDTLHAGYMGTEESIFTIMSYLEPEKFRRYSLDANGLVVKFIDALGKNEVVLEPIPEKNIKLYKKTVDPDKLKVSVYMLTFNFPHQVEHTIQTWLKHPKFLTNTRNILIDNSTNQEAIEENKRLCEIYNFEHIVTNENTGINGGRFRAAKHFQESDSDYYLFLEDDMGIYDSDTLGYCRNGFRHYVPDLYDKALKIIDGSDIDFLKLSYTEVYMDNNIQVSWYNVPQNIRAEMWPDYDKLPVTGLDPNCPKTEFKKIEVVDGLSYITGEIYYANWPMIVGKKGNQKMFLDTTWERPYEQTWMSYMFQETRKGNLNPAVLLASPIHHNRIAYYKPEERREN